MEVAISFRNLEHRQDIKDNVQEKLSKITKKFQLKIKNISVVLEKKRHLFFCEVIIQAKDLKCFGEAESDKNIFVAVDEAIDRVEVQLKKHKDKVKHRKTKQRDDSILEDLNLEEVEMENASQESIDAILDKVVLEPRVLKPMSVEEATLQMEMVKEEDFYVFENSRTEELNVIYRKRDGNFGIIQQAK